VEDATELALDRPLGRLLAASGASRTMMMMMMIIIIIIIAKLPQMCYGELMPYALLNSSTVLRWLQKQDDD